MDSTHKEFDLVRKFSVHPTYANFFWGEIASKCLSFESVANESPTWNDEAFSCPHGTKDELKFMQGSRINACYNLLDRNIDLMGLGDKPALFQSVLFVALCVFVLSYFVQVFVVLQRSEELAERWDKTNILS